MLFKDLATYLLKLEKIASRNEMTVVLAELLKKVPADDMTSVMYLLQGRVAPLYEAVEFGMADKYLMKAIALAYGVEEKEVKAKFKSAGDLGIVCEELAKNSKGNGVSVQNVFDELYKVTQINGDGAVEKKVETISNLLKSLDPQSARFVARIPVNKLRLGFSDMTVIDALSWMLAGDKSLRPQIESAYNIRPDLGDIATEIKKKGVSGIKHIKPEVFTPILMARAERLSSGEEIIAKIGETAVEPKYDGFRLQAHYDGKNVKLFTRNLEDSTFMYPDIVEGIKHEVVSKQVIMEGEAIAYDTKTGDYLPFQITTQRKRKYGIEEMAKKYPLRFVAFELLYINGKNLINESYTARRQELRKIIKSHSTTIVLSEETVISDPVILEKMFDEAISDGLEGILAKRLLGTYQAGARGWNWIKLKKSYSASALNDTVDAVVMGYLGGRGKRSDFGIGAFLIGVYDEKTDSYKTIAKVGTGLTDEEWRTLFKRAQKIKVKEKPKNYDVDKLLTQDVWVMPEIVVEIRADEITRSTIHTAGRTLKASKSGKAFDVDEQGYALRFPRLERFRDDKKPTDATTLDEIEKMFKGQRK